MRDGDLNLFDFTHQSTLNPFWAAIKRGGTPNSAPSPVGGGMGSPTVGSPSVLPVNTVTKRTPSTLKQGLDYLTDEDITALINEGATDEEILAVAEQIKEDKWKEDNARLQSPVSKTETVASTNDGEPGYLEKLGTGLISAPKQVIESGASLVERGLRAGLEWVGVKFKKEWEMGNLGYVVENPKTTAKEDVLKMASGQLGTSIWVAAPIAYGLGHSVAATDLWWTVLWAVDTLGKNVMRVGYAMSPVLSDWNEQEQDALTEVVFNAFGAKSAWAIKPKMGWERGNIAKLNVHPGQTLKNLGTNITNSFVKSLEPSHIVNKISDYVWGRTNVKPQVIGETLNKYKLTWSVDKMGAKAKTVYESIAKNELSPLFDSTTTVFRGNDILKKVKAEVDNAPLGKKPALKQRYAELEEMYKDKTFDVRSLNEEKSAFQNQTIDVDPTSAFKKQLDDKVAGIMRNEIIEAVKKDTGKDISKPFDEYSQVRTLSDAFETYYKDAGGGGLSTSISPQRVPLLRLTEGLSGFIEPIGTTLGGFIYRLGNWLELIGPKGLKGLKDLLDNSDKVKIRNPEVLFEGTPLLPSWKNTVQSANVINVKPIQVPPGGFNKPEITPKSVIRKPSTVPLRKKNIPKPKK